MRANLLGAQVGRRATEVLREPGDVLDVPRLRMWREIPNLHVLAHALPKRRHDERAWSSPGVRTGKWEELNQLRTEGKTGWINRERMPGLRLPRSGLVQSGLLSRAFLCSQAPSRNRSRSRSQFVKRFQLAPLHKYQRPFQSNAPSSSSSATGQAGKAAAELHCRWSRCLPRKSNWIDRSRPKR